jgi:hypothetical protein
VMTLTSVETSRAAPRAAGKTTATATRAQTSVVSGAYKINTTTATTTSKKAGCHLVHVAVAHDLRRSPCRCGPRPILGERSARKPNGNQSSQRKTIAFHGFPLYASRTAIMPPDKSYHAPTP